MIELPIKFISKAFLFMLLLVQLISCSGRSQPGSFHLGVEATQYQLTRTADSLELFFPIVDDSGCFAVLPVGIDLSLAEELWTNDDGLLHLSVLHEQELHVGVCARPGESHEAVTVNLRLAPGMSRVTADAPDGEDNKLIDLKVASLGDGNVMISWSEVNRGDYDFNGEANISDLVGIARSLEKSYDTSDPEAPMLTEYWVDGNQDGTVTIADITEIGQNFHRQVAGYAVNRKGAIIDPDNDGFTLLREDSTPRVGLPNFYVTQYGGSVIDSIAVIPQDIEGTQGISSNPPLPASQFSIDVNIEMELAETEFYDLDGSGSSGSFGPGKFAMAMLDIDTVEPLRRILPGEIPSSAEIGTTVLNANHAEFFDLPENRPVALALVYLPTRDLATEDLIIAPDGGPIDSFWDLEPNVNVYVLPHGASSETQTFSINLAISKIDEFKVAGFSTFTGIDGPLGSPLFQEFDDQFLSRNTEDNTVVFPDSFEDDVRLQDGKPDQDSWGVSANLLRRVRMESRSLSFNKLDFEMQAKVDTFESINHQEGWVVVRIQDLWLDGVPVPELEIPVDSVFLKYTEISQFRQNSVVPGEFDTVPPTKLAENQIIFVTGRLHREAGLEGEDIYWVDLLTIPLL